MEAGAHLSRPPLNPGDVFYVRLVAVAHDPGCPFGQDAVMARPVDRSGKVDEAGGHYWIHPSHAVTVAEASKALRAASEAKGQT